MFLYRNPTIDDLRSLHSSRQAVEDIATFIQGYETENNLQVTQQSEKIFLLSLKIKFDIS